VKLVPWQSAVVRFDRDTIQHFANFRFPDGKYVYRDVSWEDPDGVLVLLDPYDVLLRDRISLSVQFTEREWYTIMLGIVNHLSIPHASDIPHGDLRPAKGCPYLASLNRKCL
jgi:hypothetical protein